ncbi:MAG TPA: hypothetical protein VFU79_04660 [Nitrososphaeraceae archaeon]|jgi:hypothetical protein|nr:hypothetical protein [Nitrososphaeraceae archaeon]
MAKDLIIRTAYYLVKKIKRNRELNQTVYRKILSIILSLFFKIIKFLAISSLKNQRNSV